MSNPIDTKIVNKLAEILDKNGLAELEYETENFRVSLVKSRTTATACPAPVAEPTAVAAPATQAPETPAPIAEDIDVSTLPGCVKSPMVGVVYLSSDPNSANYVKIM